MNDFERFDELVEYIQMLINGKRPTLALNQKISMMVNIRFTGCGRQTFLAAWEQAIKNKREI